MDKYTKFIEEFGRALKEGLYQDHASKDSLQELVRFKSTKVDKWTGFEGYKDRMQPEQKAIYYITGENEQMLRNSPLLESFKKKDIEVLILDDEIDEIVIPSVIEYKGTPIKSVNRTDTADDLETKEDKKAQEEAKGVVEKIKKALDHINRFLAEREENKNELPILLSDITDIKEILETGKLPTLIKD